MADLTDADLAWIRDHIGTDEPPTDADLYVSFEELGSREAVAARVIRRRIAALSQPGAVNFSIAGKYAENNAALLPVLRDKLAAIEAAVPLPPGSPAQGPVTTGRIVRADRGR